MKKLVNLRPMLFMAVSLSCGIATAYFFIRNKVVWGVIFSSFFLLSILFYILIARKNIKPTLIFALLFIACFIFGGIRIIIDLDSFNNANLNNHYYEITGKVSYSGATDYGLKINLTKVSVKGNVSGRLKYGVSAYVYGNTDIDVGDTVKFSSYLFDKSYIYEGRFNVYDIESGIKYTAKINADDVIVTGSDITVFERARLFIRNTLKSGLNRDAFSVGYALLTGNPDFMDADVLSGYRTAGVAHIFAVSGLHIGFLATALSFILKKCRVKPCFSAVITVCATVFYSGMCGFSASSIRATVMTAVMMFASVTGNRYDGLSAIALAAFGILCVSPTQLLCVGFQLSFAVVLGMNLLSKPFASVLKFLPAKISSALGAVFAAQVSSIPIMMSSFGNFSWISVLVNLLFIPVVSVIFILILLLALIGGSLGIENITLYPLNYVFKMVNAVISAFDSDLFIIGGVFLGGGIVAYYAALIALSGFINLKKVAKIITVCTLVVACVINACIVTVVDYNSTKIYVSGSESVSATLIHDKSQAVLVVSDTKYIYTTSRLKRMKESAGIDSVDYLIFTGGYAVDMQVFLSKLWQVFNVDNIIYYGNRNLDMEKVIKKSFPSVNLLNATGSQTLPPNVFKCQYSYGGTALVGDVNGRKIIIFSSLRKSDLNLNDVKGDFDIAICAGRAETVLSKLGASISVSYLSSNAYPDAEKNGNMLIKLT